MGLTLEIDLPSIAPSAVGSRWITARVGRVDRRGRPHITDGTTEALLLRIRQGDGAAQAEMVRRFLPALQRWARGRLPAWARDLADTDDLVQATFLRALANIDGFESAEPGSFLSYLRSILVNQVRDQVRRVARRPFPTALPETLTADEESPLESAIGRERLEAYERALARLSPVQREAVVLRIELDLSWEDVAQAIGSSSANAARMLVARALARLAEDMDA
jgi:RNA polymerase sigma-70 factor (ECF subfamily)